MWASPYIIAIVLSWVVAQGSKYVITAIRHRTLRGFRQLYLSGNMPSAHSATVIAVTTLIGLREGVESALFGLSITFAAVVMYDAVMVRRSVGEQGVAVQQLIKETKSRTILPRAAKGHTPVEVVVGAVLGLAIGLVVYIATN
ncbi:MAG: divergent PAP2 family protein [Candidatus Saccharimonas sp.]